MRNVLLGCSLMFIGGMLAFWVGVSLLMCFAFAHREGDDWLDPLWRLFDRDGPAVVLMLGLALLGLLVFAWGFRRAITVDKKPPKES